MPEEKINMEIVKNIFDMVFKNTLQEKRPPIEEFSIVVNNDFHRRLGHFPTLSRLEILTDLISNFISWYEYRHEAKVSFSYEKFTNLKTFLLLKYNFTESGSLIEAAVYLNLLP